MQDVPLTEEDKQILFWEPGRCKIVFVFSLLIKKIQSQEKVRYASASGVDYEFLADSRGDEGGMEIPLERIDRSISHGGMDTPKHYTDVYGTKMSRGTKMPRLGIIL